MSNFMDGIKSTLNNECNVSVTENGAVGFRTTGKALLDLNFAVASLRSASEHDISQRFTKAFFEDKLMAMKWLFYARDVRGGLGERRLFRACMVPLAKEFPEYVAPVVALVPEYGRWDDLWCLLDTPACDCVTGLVKGQLYDDTQNAAEGKPISLLAKWMPRCKTSSKQTRHYAQILRKAVGMTERQYQHTLANLSRYLLVVEQQMTAKQWEESTISVFPLVPTCSTTALSSVTTRIADVHSWVLWRKARPRSTLLFSSRMTSYIGTVMPTAPTPIWKCCGRTSPIRCRVVVTPSWWPTVLVV